MKATHVVKHKRRRKGKTDYKKRLALLKSGCKRLVIRKTNKNITISLVETINGIDRTLKSMNSRKLSEFGWMCTKNTPTAYLLGYAFGKNLKTKEKLIIDFGRQTAEKKCKLYAVVKGLIDAGANVNAATEVLPEEDRLKGKHIEEYAKKLENEAFNKKFSLYLKQNFDPRIIVQKFEETKNNIDKKVVK